MAITFEESIRRIAELEKDNARLIEQNMGLIKENSDLMKEIAVLKRKKNAGRKVHNAKWQASYNEFVAYYEKGMSMAEIVRSSSISRRTAYRYKEYYDKLKDENKKD